MTARSMNRGARLELINELELARRAEGLLRTKKEALRRERVRLAGHAERTRQTWVETWHEADASLLRARVLGASDELSSLALGLARRPESSLNASIDPDWKTSMGIDYPGDVECHPGDPGPLRSTAALGPARTAFRLALMAAATHASTTTALERLDAELADTRKRHRAIEDHLVPRLVADLRELDLHLDEQDREEAVLISLATDLKNAGSL